MQVFAIRHRPSGLWVPRPSSHSRAQTSQEPGRLPRLYSTAGQAKCSLTWYTKGQFVRDQGQTHDHEGTPDWFDEGPMLKRDAEGKAIFKIGEEFRDPRDYEIVPLTLMEA